MASSPLLRVASRRIASRPGTAEGGTSRAPASKARTSLTPASATPTERMIANAASSIGREVGRSLIRGVLGNLGR
jgi:hypothetical protein